jgi:predicted AlkP superfamily pyrophosphatase or phosphodiesterase
MWTKYAADEPNDTRVDAVLEWLRLPDDRRPHVITLYFSAVDTASHRGRLDSPDVERAAKSLDSAIGMLVKGIDRLPVRDRVYLLLTSDHGMTETATEQTEALESMVDASEIEAAFGGPVANVHLRGGARRAAHVREVLNARLKHGRAYLPQDLPARFQYRDPRAGDIVVVMEEGWMLTTASSRERKTPGRWGMHGWDPELPSMHAIFVAAGPGIRPGTIIDRVQNVDVYPFMTELLELTPAPGIDGRPGAIRQRIME